MAETIFNNFNKAATLSAGATIRQARCTPRAVQNKGGGAEINKQGCMTHTKCSKRGVKLINEVVIKGKNKIIFYGKNILSKNLKKNFQVIIFL